MPAQKPHSATIGPFLTANFGKWAGGLTGQDWPALKSAVEIINAWSSSDYDGKAHCLVAFRSMVLAMQPHCQQWAFHAIAHVLDWGDRVTIWQAAGLPPLDSVRSRLP